MEKKTFFLTTDYFRKYVNTIDYRASSV